MKIVKFQLLLSNPGSAAGAPFPHPSPTPAAWPATSSPPARYAPRTASRSCHQPPAPAGTLRQRQAQRQQDHPQIHGLTDEPLGTSCDHLLAALILDAHVAGEIRVHGYAPEGQSARQEHDQPTLRLLDGVIDIYMPDMKYADAHTAFHLSKAKDYPAILPFFGGLDN